MRPTTLPLRQTATLRPALRVVTEGLIIPNSDVARLQRSTLLEANYTENEYVQNDRLFVGVYVYLPSVQCHPRRY